MKPEQLSQTAAFIAIKFYGLTRIEPYRSLFEVETVNFYDRLVKELPAPLGKYHNTLQRRWLRKFFIFSEELLLPGDLMHILMRKWYIGRMVDRLVESGYEQLLVLGSGFDHLAIKYSQQGITSYEIEAPGMAQLKKEFAAKYDYDNACLNIISAYFSEDTLGETIAQVHDLDLNKKTIVVAEGFFDYLTPLESENILKDLETHFENKITLISTVFSLEELPRLRSWVFQLGVWLVDEQLKLHQSYEEFSQMLQEGNFAIRQHVDTDYMQKKLVDQEITLPVLPGFHLLEAELR